MAIRVRLQAEAFDTTLETARLGQSGQDIGAIVSFIGLCRSENGRLVALELDYYPGMAEAELTRVAQEAEARWPLDAITIIHRHGRITPGEGIVLVLAASRHRRAAFEAADFLMDYLKTRAPFWKKEHLAAGGSGGSGGWVEAKDSDDNAAARWDA
jgi:molybdopterin synthase catalytic subunit